MNAICLRTRPWLGIITLAALLLTGLPASAAAPEREQPARLGFDAFKLVTERNIFNASRSGGRSDPPRDTRRPARVDAFGLVGVMSYERGTFAFFDGSSSDYRKALQQGGAIAGFQLLAIEPAAVKLQHGTNANSTLEMRMGMQLKREEEGDWKLGERAESYGSTEGGTSRSTSGFSGRPEGSSRSASSSATTSSPSAPADAAEALQRLLKKREQESQ